MKPTRNKYKRTLTGLIRDRLEGIEERLEIGIRQETIIDELRMEGFQTTAASFRNLLAKARKWRNEKHAKSLPKPLQNRPHTSRQGVGVTGTEKTSQCDIAKQLNSFKLEDLIKGSNGK